MTKPRKKRERLSMRTLAKIEQQRQTFKAKPKPSPKQEALAKAYHEWGRM